MSERLKRSVRLLAALALMGVGQACTSAADWTPSQSPHTIRVDLVRETHHVLFAPNATDLREKEQRALDRFLDDHGAAEASTVVLLTPGQSAGAGAVDEARIVQVVERLRQRGIDADTMYQGEAETDQIADSVAVVLERYVATPPRCPDWSKPSGSDYRNTRSSNLGCASAANLAVMVADPRDLVRGRSLAPSDPNHESAAIRRYRAGKVKKLKVEETSE